MPLSPLSGGPGSLGRGRTRGAQLWPLPKRASSVFLRQSHIPEFSPLLPHNINHPSFPGWQRRFIKMWECPSPPTSKELSLSAYFINLLWHRIREWAIGKKSRVWGNRETLPGEAGSVHSMKSWEAGRRSGYLQLPIDMLGGYEKKRTEKEKQQDFMICCRQIRTSCPIMCFQRDK